MKTNGRLEGELAGVWGGGVIGKEDGRVHLLPPSFPLLPVRKLKEVR